MSDHAIPPVPPASTPLRELARAIADALTLPSDVTSLSEQAYLRISRDHARVVLFAMRRILAGNDLDDAGLIAISAGLREQTGQLAVGNDPADPFRDFAQAVITTLTLAPDPPASELGYLQEARQRARRVLLACRRVTQEPRTDDHDLTAATQFLLAAPATGGAAGTARKPGRHPR